MKKMVKALIVMMAISGLAFMGCDNGTTSSVDRGGNGFLCWGDSDLIGIWHSPRVTFTQGTPTLENHNFWIGISAGGPPNSEIPSYFNGSVIITEDNHMGARVRSGHQYRLEQVDSPDYIVRRANVDQNITITINEDGNLILTGLGLSGRVFFREPN